MGLRAGIPDRELTSMRPWQFYFQRSLLLVTVPLVALFLILPLLSLVERTLRIGAGHALSGNLLREAIWVSLSTTTLSALFILIIGTPFAYVLARKEFPLRGLINILVDIPIVLPPAAAGIALLLAFGRNGLLSQWLPGIQLEITFTRTAVIFAQLFVAAPLYIRVAHLRFQQRQVELEEAAQVDGASPWRVFWSVTFPLAAPTLAGGIVLSWARAAGEFGATLVFAGNLRATTQTLPLLIERALATDIDAAIASAAFLLILAFFALLLARWLLRLPDKM
ncbi:MAG: ABC transporter permease [Chloroflexi bacterium]|nr:ABC transporter permease [Chloroflexota bacterium]